MADDDSAALAQGAADVREPLRAALRDSAQHLAAALPGAVGHPGAAGRLRLRGHAGGRGRDGAAGRRPGTMRLEFLAPLSRKTLNFSIQAPQKVVPASFFKRIVEA
jgi:hypothetical protein